MRLTPGSPSPLGATWDGAGVNFALFSAHATGVDLCLFDAATDLVESLSLPLTERTDHIWHGYLPGARPGQLYGYRVDGAWDPARGLRFNRHKLLLDPYARAIARQPVWHPSLFAYAGGSDGEGPADVQDSAAHAPLGMVTTSTFDWSGDTAPRVAWPDTVIYELHVRGMTALHPLVPADLRGTYLGLAAPAVVAHLKRLGVTAVELLPIHAHVDEHALVKRGLVNYWGYNTLGFFAPNSRYASLTEPAAAAVEFKTFVRAMHHAGIEVILDVVYNHTAEGDHSGPSFCFRGIDNLSYYRLNPERPARYQDFSGTGNTLNLRSPRVLQLVMDSLRFWIDEMHVDGFRFDLASALARGAHDFDLLSPFFEAIQQDPVVSRVKLIAEPWDVGPGGYQVGNFPPGWSEWNGRYRDTVRRFWRGDAATLPELATRLAGSSDLYGPAGRQPHASINFVTAHDGFTLADLVAYTTKHNLANGEDNRDGENNNLSWNGGVEGPTADAVLEERRRRQRRNLLLTLLMSQGVPMISGGDELGRTQLGNNNAYCHDSPLSWTHWDPPEAEAAFLDFAAQAVAIRASQPVLRRRRFLNGRDAAGADVVWLRADGAEMTPADWADLERRVLGMLLDGGRITEPDARGEHQTGDTLLVFFNGSVEDVVVALPPAAHGRWKRLLDTARPEQAGDVMDDQVVLTAQSVAVFSRATSGAASTRP